MAGHVISLAKEIFNPVNSQNRYLILTLLLILNHSPDMTP